MEVVHFFKSYLFPWLSTFKYLLNVFGTWSLTSVFFLPYVYFRKLFFVLIIFSVLLLFRSTCQKYPLPILCRKFGLISTEWQ